MSVNGRSAAALPTLLAINAATSVDQTRTARNRRAYNTAPRATRTFLIVITGSFHAMKISIPLFILILALSGCNAAHADKLCDVSPTETWARFGITQRGAHIGTMTTRGGTSEFLLQWFEIRYSEYDVLQSNGYFAERAQLAALLSVQTERGTLKRFKLVGSRNKERVTLRDSGPLQIAGAEQHSFEQYVDRCKDFNRQQEIEPAPMCLIQAQSAERHFSLFLSDQVFAGPTSTNGKVVELRSRPESHRWADELIADSSIRVWLGEMTAIDGAVYFVRLHIIAIPRETDSSDVLGIFTLSHKVRRLEGPMPEGSPWRSKHQFVSMLQAFKRLGITELRDPGSPQIREIVERHFGGPRTIKEITSDGVAIFGSWTKAMDAACPFSEVTHLPLFGTLNGVRVQVHSLQWDEDNREDMPSLLIARMISFDWPHDEQWDAAQDSYWIRSKAAFSLPIKFNAQENARSQANAKCN